MNEPVLDMRDLTLEFRGYAQTVKALHGISMHINRGERVALVGESGSGKSVTARIILGLLQELRSARISGKLEFEGEDLNQLTPAKRHALRGTKMAMIFQDPTSSLNPVYTIGFQFMEVLKRATPDISPAQAHSRAAELLLNVSIPDPERLLDSYAFQLSGGMNQRVMISMALANEPSLLIADEPGTALDVTVQDQTLKLMHALVTDHATAVLFISHNLGVVREFADRVYVIYKGRIVEKGQTSALFENAGHPYTKALLSAVPRITGGGISEVPEISDDFLAPMVDHGHVAEVGQ
jgi:ABC-type dipeptide/oligopeptide/nickel transport system ATPase component